jgi:diguanylate cyclase (GGDEF)-like protein
MSCVAFDVLAPSALGSVIISAIDVTEQRAHEHSLRQLAFTDSVTGLANRRALTEHLERGLVGQEPQALAVAFVDLDRFRWVNDCLGHTVGDAVLQAAGARIRSLLAAANVVFRFSADTFAVVMGGALDHEQVVGLTWAIIGRLADPLFVCGREIRVSASAGVAFQDSSATPESILRDADSALTRAKTTRRGGVQVFTEEMRAHAVERVAMEVQLRHAVERGELHLEFQPIVGLLDGRAAGSEALLRWERPRGEIVPPLSFIPLAEETGLIMSIGDWALANAVRALRAGALATVFVNLSARQLLDPALAARVKQLLRASRLKPGALGFEVTETAVIEDFSLAVECLGSLRHLGCPVGLDDFGVGYSSLGYLRHLPVDFIKLDRELVRDIGSDPQAARIAEAIISMAHSLGLTTTAEGIEQQVQADALTVMGCDHGQGWLFGRPSRLLEGKARTRPMRVGPPRRAPALVDDASDEIGSEARPD